jgi:hypothetical protein
MAEFKKYASQGSFSQNQLKAPDEVGKIREATARKVRGMNEAQAFLEKNQEIYLRAQKFAQEQEQMQREDNFRIQTENRRAFQEALQRDARIEIENDQRRSAAYQQTLSNLAQFSQTAAETAIGIAEIVQENQASAAKETIYKAGMTLDDLSAMQEIDDNLSKSEFLQTSFMLDIQESRELTEDQKDAFYIAFKNRNTKAYKTNEMLLQNEVNSYAPFLDLALSSDENRDLSALEKIELIPRIRADFLDQPGLQNQRAEVLESSGLFDAMRGVDQQIIQGLRAQAREAAKGEIETEQIQNINSARIKKGAAGVIGLLQEKPSKELRELITRTYVNAAVASGPNAVTAEHVRDLLETPTESNGKLIPYGERFDGTDAIADLHKLERALRTKSLDQYDLDKEVQNREVEREAERRVEEVINNDGYLDKAELYGVEQFVRNNASLDYASPVLESAKRLTLTARSEAKAAEILDSYGIYLTKDIVADMQLTGPLLATYMQRAESYEARMKDPQVTEIAQRLRDLIAGNPQVAPAIQQKQHLASIDFVQDRFERAFYQAVEIYSASSDNPTEILQRAEADVTQKIEKYLQPGVFSNDYGFKEYQETMVSRRSELGDARKEYDLISQALLNPNVSKNPSIIAGALNKDMIQESFDEFGQPGWQPLPIIRNVAERMNMDPFSLYNYIAEEMERDPIEPPDATLAEIKKSLPPMYRRGYDKYRTDERVNRSNAVVFNRVGNLPVRPAFESSGLLPLIREGEGGAMNYNAANRGYAGDTPGGIVNLDTYSVGTWLNLYNSGWNALGAYQVIRSTFQGSVNRLKLPENTVMDKQTQDLIAVELIAGGTKRPALSAYVNGESDDIDAALKDLANEWAAVATEAGNSAYDGIAGNASNIGADEAKQALIKLREMLTSTN